MKRISLAVVLVLAVSIAVFAQESNIPTSAQTKDSASQYLNQAKSDSDGFDSVLADLRARNVSNADLWSYTKLKDEIESLKAQIKAEERRLAASLNTKKKLNDASFEKIDNLIAQHKAKQEELQQFISSK